MPTETDRELLELAAKAAGEEYVNLLSHDKWCPLTDDGDALRLAVKLRINVYTPLGDADVSASCYLAKTDSVVYCNERSDNEAATRRAIVRAAAELGRKK